MEISMRRTKQQWLVKTAGLMAMMAAGGMALTPAPAEACGGTFCDGGVPGPMPVDQTGENVIFVLGDGGSDLEVHIQINVDPDTNAEKFGWLVPLSAVPEFSVGSQPLFSALLSASVPTYGLTTTFESCGFGETSSASDSGPVSSGGGTTSGGEGESSGGGEPTVLKEEQIGAFQIAVLQGVTIEPIKTWLIDNGYVWDENAAGILQQYLDEGNLIVALKLAAGSGVEDVHPIMLKYPATETCFPLRLTRIAAVEDMDIRVFVLADSRAAPTNYRHVLVNPLKIDWLNLAINYKTVITNAVDAFKADGRAFVTEYAGPGPKGGNLSVYDPAWDQAAFVGLDPAKVVTTLNAQGLSSCFDIFSCTWNHPLVFPMLLEYLPPPVGVEAIDFYSDLGTYAAQIDVAKWNGGAEFSVALLDRVITPGMHADELLATWPYLTRMYTTISPAEMMEDPIFHQNPDMPEVPNLLTAQNYILCNGDGVVTLPDGREFYIPGASPWPAIPGEEWFAEEVQTVALKGAPMTLVNNTAAINQKLSEWNLSYGWPRVPGDTGAPTTSDTESAGTDTASGSSGSDTATGGQNSDSGCGCRSSDDPQGAAWMALSAIGLLGLRRRRS
jgi:MYXO-CTERM domain-containing protein